MCGRGGGCAVQHSQDAAPPGSGLPARPQDRCPARCCPPHPSPPGHLLYQCSSPFQLLLLSCIALSRILISIAQAVSEVVFLCVSDYSFEHLPLLCPNLVPCGLAECGGLIATSLQQHVARSLLGRPASVQAMCPLSCSFHLLQSKLQFVIVISSPSGQIGVATLCRWAGHGCSLLVRQLWQCWWRAMVRCAPWCCAMGGWPAWPACCTLLEPRARKQLQKPSRHAPHHLHPFVPGCYVSQQRRLRDAEIHV